MAATILIINAVSSFLQSGNYVWTEINVKPIIVEATVYKLFDFAMDCRRLDVVKATASLEQLESLIWTWAALLPNSTVCITGFVDNDTGLLRLYPQAFVAGQPSLISHYGRNAAYQRSVRITCRRVSTVYASHPQRAEFGIVIFYEMTRSDGSIVSQTLLSSLRYIISI